MKKVLIIVPSRGRTEKLKNMLDSIPREPWVEVSVGADGCLDTWEMAGNHPRVDNSYMFTDHMGSVFVRNEMAPKAADGLFWASDDIEFYPDTLSLALECFNERFPDDDGVLGIFQETPTFHPTGTVLMGQEFLKRYPWKKPFYPKYWLFAAQEIFWLADKLGKYQLCPDCKIQHNHPAFDKSQADKTHTEGRVHKKRDQALARRRLHMGLIWGDKEE